MANILTYQDLQAAGQDDRDRLDFVKQAITGHEGSYLFKIAKIADDYDRQQNTTIKSYEKTITTASGRLIKDKWSPNHKSASNFFHIFVTQLVNYLLGNGVTWKTEGFDPLKLGADFDNRLQETGKYAVRDSLAFGFFNFDHLEAFPVYDKNKPCFAPLQDEENGGFRAGVRYWSIPGKHKRGTLYEEDGLTEYIWDAKSDFAPQEAQWERIGDGCWMIKKKPYKITTLSSQVDGTRFYAGENYPTFPIVPMWGNSLHQSEIVGLRPEIDAYDLILNGFENDLDNAQLYWVVKGAAGMNSEDLSEFLQRLYMNKIVNPGPGQEIVPAQIEIPYSAREVLLDRLEKQMYKDAMLLNPGDIAGGAATATQIRAAYEPQNVKADDFEYCVLDFIQGVLQVAELSAEASFTRSMLINKQEEIQSVLQAAEHLSGEYVTTKLLTLLGDGDQAESVLEAMQREEIARAGMQTA